MCVLCVWVVFASPASATHDARRPLRALAARAARGCKRRIGIVLSYTNTASSGARKRAMANALRGL